jgi:Mn2+/Fe2+ NRAMP family transporter
MHKSNEIKPILLIFFLVVLFLSSISMCLLMYWAFTSILCHRKSFVQQMKNAFLCLRVIDVVLCLAVNPKWITKCPAMQRNNSLANKY